MGQQLLWEHSLWRDWNSDDLPGNLISLLKIKEGVGEVEDVFVGVDIRHGKKG